MPDAGSAVQPGEEAHPKSQHLSSDCHTWDVHSGAGPAPGGDSLAEDLLCNGHGDVEQLGKNQEKVKVRETQLGLGFAAAPDVSGCLGRNRGLAGFLKSALG